jgi:hypothetical protein
MFVLSLMGAIPCHLKGSVLLAVSCASTLVPAAGASSAAALSTTVVNRPLEARPRSSPGPDHAAPNDLDFGLDQLSLRTENARQALLADALLLSNAGFPVQGSRGALEALSRRIVSLLSPDCHGSTAER